MKQGCLISGTILTLSGTGIVAFTGEIVGGFLLGLGIALLVAGFSDEEAMK
jgi:hypothetical protein